jgi:hypothetical protein
MAQAAVAVADKVPLREVLAAQAAKAALPI